MDECCDALAAWPMVARLTERLLDLRRLHPALRDFSPRCLRGRPAADTLFLVYEREMIESPNPGYGRDAGAPAIRRSFGEEGVCLQLRFDRGAARVDFPILSVCDFGDAQISLMIVEGPTTPRFRELENAVWGIVYEEAVRYEFECERSRALESPGPSDSGPEPRRTRR